MLRLAQIWRVTLVAAVMIGLATFTAFAQAPNTTSLDRPLRVFIDCRGPGCDQAFFRTELAWIDHVRDQMDADVHVLVTAQGTGGGGTEYTLRFIGQSGWQGQEDTFTRATEAGGTDDDRRRALVQAFGLGLARFAAVTPVGLQLRIASPAAITAPLQTVAKADGWNFWVFRTNLNLNLNGEQSNSSRSFNVNQSATRTTAEWKVNFNAGVNRSTNAYELSSGNFVTTRRGWNVNGLTVKSLNDHWSVALKGGASRSTFLNQKLAARFAPGVEFNVFPYAQSTSRTLIMQWTVGPNRFVYDEPTIYGKLDESRWEQTALAQLNLRQPFGTVGLATEIASYLDHPDHYRFVFNADTEFRVSRGLTLRLDGNYQVLHDQLYLRRGTSTDEEIIARQRQLQTSYRYLVSIGLTYRFGSINNNVVNPRFGGGPGGGFPF